MTSMTGVVAQRGVSLVELMIGMALGLLMLAAIGYIYSGSRESYRLQDNLAGMQENAGFALEVLAQDVRMAGYIGCPRLGASGNDVTPVMQAGADSRVAFDLDNAAMPAGKTVGYRDQDVPPVLGVLTMAASGLRGTASITESQLPQTDLLVVTRGSSQTFVLKESPSVEDGKTSIDLPSRAPMPSSPAGLGKTKEDGAEEPEAQKDVLIISDCSKAHIFHVEDLDPPDPRGGPVKITANAKLEGDEPYQAGAMVMGLETSAYFIRNNPSGNPALYRARWAPDATEKDGSPDIDEVAENVVNMRVLFGVDTNDDGSADDYFPAAKFDGNAGSPTWNQVVSVRVSLLLRSASDTAASQPQPYRFDTDGDGDLDDVSPGDRHLYRVHTATMAIRNRATGGQ